MVMSPAGRPTTGPLTAAFAALLLIAGCSPAVDDAGPASASQAPSTSREPNPVAVPPTPSLSVALTVPASGGTSSVAPAVLDQDSEKWFTTYCLGAAEVALQAKQTPAGGTLAELQAGVAAIYGDIAISASTAVGVLRATPAPSIDGGDDLQVYALEYFSFLSDVYGRGAVTIDGLAPVAESDLQAAVQAIEQEAAASAPTPMAGVDAAVLAAAGALPQCQGIL